MTTAPRSRRLPILLAAAAALACGGFFVFRWYERSAERRAVLARAESGQPSEVLPALHRALDRAPDDAELLRAVVRTMAKLGGPVADVEPFSARWCAIAPDDPEPFRFRTDLMTRLKRPQDAAAAAERVVALAPNDHPARNALAGLYLALGRFDDAAREFRHLLDVSPLPRTDLKVGLARAAFERDNPAEAARLLDEALGEAPDVTAALVLRGMTHYRLGEYGPAVEKLARAKADTQHQKEIVLYYLGLCFDRLGKADDAKKAFNLLAAVQTARAFREDAGQRPDDVSLQVRAAEALLSSDQPHVARADLEEAVARLGPHKSLLQALAKCYDKLGDPARAKAARDRAANIP